MGAIHVLHNVNIYCNGENFLGTAREVEVANLEYEMVDSEILGLFGSPMFPGGLNEIETTITWAAPKVESLLAIANPFKMNQWQFRGSVEVYDSTGKTKDIPIVMFCNGLVSESESWNQSKLEAFESETTFQTFYLKQQLDGRNILEIDVLANILKVDGVDVMAQWRQNLGV